MTCIESHTEEECGGYRGFEVEAAGEHFRADVPLARLHVAILPTKKSEVD
jgi:hypothetical protein